MKNIVKKENSIKKVFKGVNLDSLAYGEKSIVTKMNYVKGNFASIHKHPYEQSGYVISGKYILTFDKKEYELSQGDSYSIPENIEHSFKVLEGGEVVDVFTPIRKEYLWYIEIVEYREEYKKYFIEFNTKWIVDNFGTLEENDIQSFNNIEQNLKNGAKIFFAVKNDIPLACCMALPIEDGNFEICKLASNDKVPHKGAGSAVFKVCLDFAKEKNAKKIIIISNAKLKPALHIYQKFGFKEVKLADYHYARGDIAFEYKTK